MPWTLVREKRRGGAPVHFCFHPPPPPLTPYPTASLSLHKHHGAGWITDMAPLGAGASSRVHESFIGPPLDEVDGASRVLDPVFSCVASGGRVRMVGLFLKDYMSASW